MGLSLDLGRPLETMSRCRQTMAMPVNFAFLVPQAIMKGLAKLALFESSNAFSQSPVWIVETAGP